MNLLKVLSRYAYFGVSIFNLSLYKGNVFSGIGFISDTQLNETNDQHLIFQQRSVVYRF